ncbi:MAG: FUSC family protein [Xanthobacteraceae bacterium]
MNNTDHRAIAPSPRFVDRASDAFARLLALAPSAGPPLLFGLRLWAAVCLALYVVFWLELDSPFWAGTTPCATTHRGSADKRSRPWSRPRTANQARARTRRKT